MVDVARETGKHASVFDAMMNRPDGNLRRLLAAKNVICCQTIAVFTFGLAAAHWCLFMWDIPLFAVAIVCFSFRKSGRKLHTRIFPHLSA